MREPNLSWVRPPTYIRRHMAVESPTSPVNCDVSDHIWDSRITAIEVFYSERQSDEQSVHGLLVRDQSNPLYWQCDAEVSLPGIGDRFPCYATQDIVEMIRSEPSSNNSRHSRRSRRHRRVTGGAVRMEVHSVRISYQGRYFFLDRDEDDWHTWSGGPLTLTTHKLLEILPHAYEDQQSEWFRKRALRDNLVHSACPHEAPQIDDILVNADTENGLSVSSRIITAVST